MQTATNHSLVRFNQSIDQWIDALETYTLDILRQKPHPDTWSLGQVYVHLTNDTAWFIEQVKLAAASTDNSDQPMKGDGKWLFRNDGFPDKQIIGPPSNDNVPQPSSKEMLQQQLLEIRGQINQLCASTDIEQSTGKTQHPGLGYFTASEWLRFAEMHLRHHLRQKKRIEEVIGVVSKSISIYAPAKTIWRFLTEPASVQQWLADTPLDIVIEGRVGGALRTSGDLHGSQFENKGVVLQWQPYRLWQYTQWSSLSDKPHQLENESIITFTLTPQPAGSILLNFTQTNAIPEVAWKHVDFYWNVALALIKKLSKASNY